MIDLESAIAATRNGDVESFGWVIEACHAHVRAYIASFVRDANDVNDIEQQTFVFAFEHLNEYEPGTHFLAWLKAIARNEVLSHRERTRRKRESQRLFEADRLLQRVAELLPNRVEDRVSALGRCMEELPKEQRTFLVSVTGRRGTLEEWSVGAGFAANVVRKRISRLYAALRNCIEHRIVTGDLS